MKEPAERDKLFNAIEHVPCVQKKAQWALKWIDSSRSFAERLIAFAAVEGVFFSGSFCAIFWLKKRGLMPGLGFSNELISRDEGLHCVARGTLVSTEFDAIPIEQLASNVGEMVMTYDEKAPGAPGLVLRPQAAFTPSGTKECVELTMEDGRTLVCTPDHKILTKRGWIRADNLVLDQDAVFVSEPPSSFTPTDEDLRQEVGWSVGEWHMRAPEARRKALAFGRVLGHLVTDGALSRHRDSNQAVLFAGHKLEAESVQRDCVLAFGNNVTSSSSANEAVFYIRLSRKIATCLTSLGLPVGARVNSPHYIPDFIMQAPRSFKRAFLMGFFGGDGVCPSSKRTKKSFTIMMELRYSLSKVVALRDAGQRRLAQVITLLAEFGVNATPDPIMAGPNGTEYHGLTIDSENMLKFAETLGFAHCGHKQVRLGAAVAVLKMRNRQITMNKTNRDRIDELQGARTARSDARALGLTGSELWLYAMKNNKMSLNQAYDQAVKEFKSTNAVVGTVTSKAGTRGAINVGRETRGRYTWDILTRFGGAKFFRDESDNPSAKENDDISDHQTPLAQEDGVDDDGMAVDNNPEPTRKKHNFTSATYAIPRGVMSIPALEMKVIRRANVGPREVFDITVDETHNFAANGVVVHNCDFACLLYNTMRHKLPESTVHEIVRDAVTYEKEFVGEALPVSLLGMNAEMMKTYIEFCADRLLISLGVDPIYHAKNPFDWMELISLTGKTNFFERRVSEYKKASVNTSQELGKDAGPANQFSLDEDF